MRRHFALLLALAVLATAALPGTATAQGDDSALLHALDDCVEETENAILCLREPAGQGNAIAQYNLGMMYEFGVDVPQDYAEAVKWYRLAAEQGIADAQSRLGTMYDYGQGVPQDFVQAHMWYNLAAAASAGEIRDTDVENRDSVAAKMTPGQLAEAQRLAREWTPTVDE